MLTVVCVCVCRRKAVPLWLGGMWLEVCPFGRAHEALQEAHGTSAISVPKMRQSLLSVRPPCTAHETTSITKTGRPPIKWLVNHVLPLNKSQRNSMTSCVVHSIRVGTCLFFVLFFSLFVVVFQHAGGPVRFLHTGTILECASTYRQNLEMPSAKLKTGNIWISGIHGNIRLYVLKRPLIDLHSITQSSNTDPSSGLFCCSL